MDMKTKLTEVYNQASLFFWYPPGNLMNEQYAMQKHKRLTSNQYPGNGLSYTLPSSNLKEGVKMRSTIFNNDYRQTNQFKANWKSLRSDNNKFNYLKSGVIQQDFSIKVKSVGNLLKVIDDLSVGKNTVLDIHEYKYLDMSYEMKYGYDYILDTPQAKEHRKDLKRQELQDQETDAAVRKFADMAASRYQSEVGKILGVDITERMQQIQKEFNFQNSLSNKISIKEKFKNQSFNIIPQNKKKKKAGHGKKAKTETTYKISPQSIQIEAALYLGCERISHFSYSSPQPFSQNIEFEDEELFFYSITDKAEQSLEKPKLKLSNLPSNTRLVLQLILLPEPFSALLTNGSLPNRSGYIFGSIAMPLYDLNRRLKQGVARMLAWPL
jgi:hypothetical protein